MNVNNQFTENNGLFKKIFKKNSKYYLLSRDKVVE